MRKKYWVCVKHSKDIGAWTVPPGVALYGKYLREDNPSRGEWPIWDEEPDEKCKELITRPTEGTDWYLIEVEYDPDTNQCY